MTSSSRRAERAAVVVVPGEAGPAVWLAAHLMSERAYVRLSPAEGGTAVELRPKKRGGGAGLAAEFKRALESQRHRWALAQASLPERAAVLSRALELTRRLAEAQRGARTLPAAKARELAALAAAPVDDPLGIRASWDSRSGS